MCESSRVVSGIYARVLCESLFNEKKSVNLDDVVVRRVLDLYPEEKLFERPIFKTGLAGTPVDFQKFQEECDKILIPWQLFLLTETNLGTELAHIESLRQKVSQKLFAKRRGNSNVTSKRIIDRLIRCQNYVTQNGTFPKHNFCGSLKGMRPVDAAAHIAAFFEIDVAVFRSKKKSSALAYLIKRLEEKNINVCQGVLTNKILPEVKGVRDVYKGTSGFVIKDEKVPFIFIPSEINPDEKDGRQIYTLAYLLTIIGLEEYEYILNKDFKASLLASRGLQKRIYNIASEFFTFQALGYEISLLSHFSNQRCMKQLTKKDWAIVGLFFILLLIISPLFGLVDETSLEDALPGAMGLLGGVGFVLSMPISFVTSLFKTSPMANLNLISWLTAIIYSAILAFILAKYNSSRAKK